MRGKYTRKFFDTIRLNQARANWSFQCFNLKNTANLGRPQTSFNSNVFCPSNYNGGFLSELCECNPCHPNRSHISIGSTGMERLPNKMPRTSQNSTKRITSAANSTKKNANSNKVKTLKIRSIIKWISRRHYISIKKHKNTTKRKNHPLKIIKLNTGEMNLRNSSIVKAIHRQKYDENYSSYSYGRNKRSLSSSNVENNHIKKIIPEFYDDLDHAVLQQIYK